MKHTTRESGVGSPVGAKRVTGGRPYGWRLALLLLMALTIRGGSRSGWHGHFALQPAAVGPLSDENGPCELSWMRTPEGAGLRVPEPLRQLEQSLPGVERWSVPDLRALAQRTPEAATSPVTRAGKLLVVMVEYSDLSFNTVGSTPTATHGEWRRRIHGLTTQTDGSLHYDAAVDSLTDYWQEASFGRVNLSPAPEGFDNAAATRAGFATTDALANDGIVQVRLDLEPYQLGYYWTLQPRAEYTYMAAALQAADAYVDFERLDVNHDGVVDHGELAILLIFANPYREEMGDWVWAHRFALPPRSLKLDGVSVAGGDPSITPTISGGSYLVVDQFRSDRTIRHEFGHDLGLPDLYNVSVTGDRHNDGIGEWGVMASSEGLPDGWSRLQLGWVQESDGTLQRFSSPGRWHLSIPSSSRSVLKPGLVSLLERPGGVGQEYFLLENRQLEGQYDRHLPGEGLLLFHVLDNRILYRLSAVNLGTGQRVMGLKVMEADGAWDLLDPTDNDRGDAGDPFLPGDRFAPDTEPGASWYGGRSAQLVLDNIDQDDADGTLCADLCVGVDCD